MGKSTSVITVRQLAELAMQSEVTDPIDWGELLIREEDAYQLMASHVLEMFEGKDNTLTMQATIVKLLVENFVLNLKLRGYNG